MAYDRSVKVSQKTVDSMKQMGMAKAIERANSGGGDSEFVEAAKRFYGNRVKSPKAGGPRMRPSGPQGHIIEEVAAKPTLSKNAPQKRLEA